MSRRSWRYIFVLLALGLLTSLTLGSALAAQPGNGKGNAKGPKNKGKIVHVNGTVVQLSGDVLTVAPKAKGKGNTTNKGNATAAPADNKLFTITGDTKIAGEGATADAKATRAQLVKDARVNVVGRMSADGKTVVAQVVVVLGPEDADDNDK